MPCPYEGEDCLFFKGECHTHGTPSTTVSAIGVSCIGLIVVALSVGIIYALERLV